MRVEDITAPLFGRVRAVRRFDVSRVLRWGDGSGARLMGIVVYLLPVQFIPEDRLVELIADLFGVKLPPPPSPVSVPAARSASRALSLASARW